MMDLVLRDGVHGAAREHPLPLCKRWHNKVGKVVVCKVVPSESKVSSVKDSQGAVCKSAINQSAIT